MFSRLLNTIRASQPHSAYKYEYLRASQLISVLEVRIILCHESSAIIENCLFCIDIHFYDYV